MALLLKPCPIRLPRGPKLKEDEEQGSPLKRFSIFQTSQRRAEEKAAHCDLKQKLRLHPQISLILDNF